MTKVCIECEIEKEYVENFTHTSTNGKTLGSKKCNLCRHKNYSLSIDRCEKNQFKKQLIKREQELISGIRFKCKRCKHAHLTENMSNHKMLCRSCLSYVIQTKNSIKQADDKKECYIIKQEEKKNMIQEDFQKRRTKEDEMILKFLKNKEN